MEFKDVFRKLRTNKGLTQEELGRKFNVIKQTVSSWENGNSKPDISLAANLADFFGVSVDQLLGRDDPTEAAKATIREAIQDDAELLEFWDVLKEREDLQLFFKQTKRLSPATIQRVIRYIKMVEDEEAKED